MNNKAYACFHDALGTVVHEASERNCRVEQMRKDVDDIVDRLRYNFSEVLHLEGRTPVTSVGDGDESVVEISYNLTDKKVVRINVRKINAETSDIELKVCTCVDGLQEQDFSSRLQVKLDGHQPAFDVRIKQFEDKLHELAELLQTDYAQSLLTAHRKYLDRQGGL